MAPATVQRLKSVSALLQMTDIATNGFPSIVSHMTNAFLNHEVLALPVLPKRRGVPPLQTFAPFKSILPCDFRLVNLRSIQGQVKTQNQSNTHIWTWDVEMYWLDSFLCVFEQQDPHSPSPYTAMILHRMALDCSLEAQNLGFNCTTTQGQVIRTHAATHRHTHTQSRVWNQSNKVVIVYCDQLGGFLGHKMKN